MGEAMSEYDATYSPDDNKLRLYAGGRLPEEVYQRVRAEGFRWAPKQDLFVAPAWTPAREDLLLELCGEIGDEDSSLTERAEERADRFEGYQANRAKDAESAHKAVHAITDGIPMGQPILVGHHSEKHARKDAERIENGMRRAVKMWETSKYWESRAAGALRHAKYKELPAVRCRRIKKLEAERRKLVAEYTPHEPRHEIMQEPNRTPRCAVCSRFKYGGGECEGHEFVWPETPAPTRHVWAGSKGSGTWVEVASLPAIEKGNSRMIAHLDRRLLYERAMLAEGGHKEPEKPKRPKLPPILNYRSAEPLENPSRYHRGEIEKHRQIGATKAALAKIGSEYKGTRTTCDGSHRFRIARASGPGTPHRGEPLGVGGSVPDRQQGPSPPGGGAGLGAGASRSAGAERADLDAARADEV